MTKTEFILTLSHRLSPLPQEEIAERTSFYIEIIDEYIEEGLSEAEAVERIGDPEEIISQILKDTAPVVVPEANYKPKKKRKVWQTVLLIVGSPVWVALLIAGAAMVLALYIALWALILSLWSVFVSSIGSSLGFLIAGIVWICNRGLPAGVAMMGAALICAGLAILLYYGCMAATRGTICLTKKFFSWTSRAHND